MEGAGARTLKKGGCADNDGMKRNILPVLLLLGAAVQAETNYCHDLEANQAWNEIRRHHRGERDMEAWQP